MFEGLNGFDNWSLRSKMTEIMRESSDELQEQYYEMGIENNLPHTWEEFKEFVVGFCVEENLYLIQKYKEESWSRYCVRLYEWCKIHNVSEENLMKKLRKESLPRQLQGVFYSVGVEFKVLLDLVKEFENSVDGHMSYERTLKRESKHFERENRVGSAIKCYKCGKNGHISKNCFGGNLSGVKCFNCSKTGHISKYCLEKKLNNVKICKNGSIDTRKIRLNGHEYEAVFDTGATDNMICSSILDEINVDKLSPKIKEYEYFDGGSNRTIGTVNLELEYGDNKEIQEFNVVKNDKLKNILICNNTVKELTKEKKIIPVECIIDTGKNDPISWNRPLKSFKDKKDFELLLKELESKKIIEPSTSLWLNPVVLTRKKNGKLRFCIDFRKLNDLVKQDEFEIPRINELLMTLNDQKYFTKLDLEDGFFHVPVRNCDKEKTTFYTGEKLMQFVKMPQGYKNSPAIFQRLMNIILKGKIGRECIVYIDDILVFGRSKEEHDTRLEEILQILRMYGLNENREKRIDCVNNISFLGYNIEYNKIEPCFERTQGIIDYIVPNSKKSLQRFLGLLNYDRMFIPNITEKAKTLYSLLKKDEPFKWNEEHDKAFNDLKCMWKETLEVYIPDMEKQFELETDASNVGLGAALRQDGKPIAYASRSLSVSEKLYGITEKEVLAALWGMEKFRFFLLGKKFLLITDHKAMEELKTKKDFGSARVQRWFTRLENFQFEIKYKKGEELKVSDALSRAPMQEVQGGEEINKEMIDEIMKVHEKFNHRKTLNEELKQLNINISQTKLLNILSNCIVCKRKDTKRGKTCKYISVLKPGEKIGIDILHLDQKIKIIMAIDYFSRKLFAKLVSTKESYKIVEFLENLYLRFPFENIVMDNGKEFSNKEVKKWTEKREVKYKYTIPYYHQSNGRIERANRTIRNAFRKSKGTAKMNLQNIIGNYNNIKHRAIGMTPNEACKEENWSKVKVNEIKYKQEFEKRNKKEKKYEIGDRVLIKNEHRKTKMDDEFHKEGNVEKLVHENVYLIKDKDGKMIKRHASQLRAF
ncbi:MAG: reverse transcriptase domain-containing protein [Aeromonas sp.]